MMGLITLAQLAEQAGATDTSTLRKDIKAGLLAATLYGKVWLVDEAEGERWMREVWPQHEAKRRKPAGARTKKRE
jgi:hypothetical protein